MFKIFAQGHENISAKHKTTLEVTKEGELTPRGDCIIGVNADKSVSDIPDNLRLLLKKGLKFEIEITLPDYGLKDMLTGYGSEKLILSHPTDVVVRKSRYICPRTLLVSSNKAARDINREIVEMLKDRKTEIVVTLRPLQA
ncbi:DUF371 domain-containing protein [Archaeoglobus sp.]